MFALPSQRGQAITRLHRSPAVRALLALSLLVCCGGVAQAAGEVLRAALSQPDTAILVEVSGRPVIAHQADRPMIPASTMKLLTALAAIERWGLGHRFATDVHLGPDGWLWVRGSGDPLLVSEELNRMAAALRRAGVPALPGIGVDGGLYPPALDIPGRAASDNPYDAPVTALAVNFNTVHLLVRGGGVQSAEPQTPLTPVARRLGERLGPGRHRVNLQSGELAERYAGELLAAKLRDAGIAVGHGYRTGRVPDGAELLLRYRNSASLREVLSAMLAHSNNVVANQLFLLLGAEDGGAVRDLETAQQAMTDWVERRFAWRGFRIEDGAGLSRGNRLSARQLLDVVDAMAPYRQLLPVQPGNPAVRAKTGTLTGVSTYAGLVRRGGDWASFAMLANRPMSAASRRRLADDLARVEEAWWQQR